MKHLNGADGIRGFACLIVISLHSIGFFFNNIQFYTLGMDKLGVWMFFVLSSFLLTRQFIIKGFSSGVIIDYTISRTLRILPAFLICVFIYFKLGMIPKEKLIPTITFRDFYFHLWTIPIEFKYYFILPFSAFMFYLASKRFGTKGLLISCLIISFIFQHFLPINIGVTPAIALYPYIPCFLYGSVAAILIDHVNLDGFLKDYVGAAILLSFICVSPGFINLVSGVYLGPYIIDKYNYVGILISVFIMMYATGCGKIGMLLSSRFLSFIGRYSFSIYLYHVIFLKYISDRHPSSLWWCILSFVISIIAGYVMFNFVERPLLKARKTISSKLIPALRSL